jgi:hypothetical protein
MEKTKTFKFGKCPDRYGVTESGKVYNLTNGREMGQHVDASGYLYATFSCGGLRQKVRVHRLVASLFQRPILPNEVVDHLDGVKENNNNSNLEIVSYSTNTTRWHGQKDEYAKNRLLFRKEEALISESAGGLFLIEDETEKLINIL